MALDGQEVLSKEIKTVINGCEGLRELDLEQHLASKKQRERYRERERERDSDRKRQTEGEEQSVEIPAYSFGKVNGE